MRVTDVRGGVFNFLYVNKTISQQTKLFSEDMVRQDTFCVGRRES